MHLRTLKRKLKDLGLKRRGEQFQEEVVRQAIEKDMREAGSLAGYRSIWHALRSRHGLIVPRHVVSTYMKDIDPVGVRERRSRRLRRRAYVSYGPNFVWHIDGNYYTVIASYRVSQRMKTLRNLNYIFFTNSLLF